MVCKIRVNGKLLFAKIFNILYQIEMLNVAIKQKETVEIKSVIEFTFAVLEIASISLGNEYVT